MGSDKSKLANWQQPENEKISTPRQSKTQHFARQALTHQENNGKDPNGNGVDFCNQLELNRRSSHLVKERRMEQNKLYATTC
jgi:hypothetical protein